MQHVLLVIKKRLVQGCKNAVARPKRGVRTRFYHLLYFI